MNDLHAWRSQQHHGENYNSSIKGRNARCTTAAKKHNRSTADTLLQYRGKSSRHSRGQALTEFASDRNIGATCLKPPKRTIEALAPEPSPLVSLFLRLTPAAFTP